MKVAELYAAFSIKNDSRGVGRALQSIRQVRFGLMSLASMVGAGALVEGMISFNSRVQDAKNSIAGMLALGSKTTFASQLETADKLYESIRKKAAALPGTTEEYVQAMAKLTLPIMSAGMGLKELEDLTVNTVVAAKAGVGGATVKTATTDVLQGIEGRFSTTDFFLKAILEPLDNGKYTGEAGRKLFKGLSKGMRAKEIQRGLMNPVFADMGKAQGQSWSGQMDKMKEATAQFLGRVGLPLFKKLTVLLDRANTWLAANSAAVDAFADRVGEGLVAAFDALGDVVEWFIENQEWVKKGLVAIAVIIGVILVKATLAWLATWGPIMLAVTALIEIFKYLQEKIGTVGAVIAMVFGAALLLKFGLVVKGIRSMAAAMGLYRAAAVAAGRVPAPSMAGNAVNALGAGGMGLGPAGAAAAGAAPAVAGAAGIGGKLKNLGGKVVGGAKYLPFVGFLSELDEAFGGAFTGQVLTKKLDDLRGNPELMDQMRAKYAAENGVAPVDPAAAALPPTPTSIDASMNITVQGVNLSQAQLEAALAEIQDKQLRQLQLATNPGGR